MEEMLRKQRQLGVSGDSIFVIQGDAMPDSLG